MILICQLSKHTNQNHKNSKQKFFSNHYEKIPEQFSQFTPPYKKSMGCFLFSFPTTSSTHSTDDPCVKKKGVKRTKRRTKTPGPSFRTCRGRAVTRGLRKHGGHRGHSEGRTTSKAFSDPTAGGGIVGCRLSPMESGKHQFSRDMLVFGSVRPFTYDVELELGEFFISELYTSLFPPVFLAITSFLDDFL